MKPNLLVYLFTILFLCGCSTYNGESNKGRGTDYPVGSVVKDEATAIKIGVAIAESVYGKEEVRIRKPFTAKLNEKGIWWVRGIIPEKEGCVSFGNAIFINIKKSDGSIVFIDKNY